MAVNVIARLKIKNGANEPIAEGPDVAASCAVVANTTARDAIKTNVKGSSYLVYRVDLPGFEYWNGSAWTAVASGGGAGASGFTQVFDSSTADADPGDEEFRLNHATPASATAIYLDDLAADATNVRDLIASWGALPGTIKGRLTLRDATAPENWITYSVGGYTSATGYGKLTGLAVIDSSATVTLSGDVSIEFDAGPTGVLLADGTVALSASWDVGNQAIDDVKAISYEGEIDDGNSGAADTIDWSTGSLHKSTLTGNCTYTFTAPQPWTAIQLRVVQDATGGRTVTWPGTVVWDKGYAPVMAGGPNVETIISGYYDGTNYRLVNPDRGVRQVTESGTTRTLVATDANALINCTHASGCSATIPPHVDVPYELGTVILFKQTGAAQVTLVPGSGVTLDTSETLKTLKVKAVIGAIKMATNTWLVFGEREIA